MNTAPIIFNRALWRKRRKRASLERGFLFNLAAQEMSERIHLTQYQFPLALNIGWHGNHPLPSTPKVRQWLQCDSTHPMLRQSPHPAFIADEENLPLKPQSLNLITSILNLHWVNNLPASLHRIRQSLKPDGLFLAALFAAGTLKELRQSLLLAESEIRNAANPHIIPLADIRDLGNLMQHAHFALPVTDLVQIKVRYNNLTHLLHDLQAMGESQALQTRKPATLTQSVLTRAKEIYQEQFSDPDGKLIASFHFAWLSGWAPAANQPKPLKPGSAKMSMAEAVKNISRQKI